MAYVSTDVPPRIPACCALSSSQAGVTLLAKHPPEGLAARKRPPGRWQPTADDGRAEVSKN